MAGKPKLHYFNARGRMESIRWLLAAAGVEEVLSELFRAMQQRGLISLRVDFLGNEMMEILKFEEIHMKTKGDLEKLRSDGLLMFQQVPLVEIDGMKLVQTRAILNYIANKHNLYGKDIKERALYKIQTIFVTLMVIFRNPAHALMRFTLSRIDMYTEGMADLDELILHHSFFSPEEKEKSLPSIKEKAKSRYFPAFEKVLKSHGQDYLVGNKLSKADILLVEQLYNMEELDPTILSSFPQLKALKTRVSSLPTVKKFLQPGSQRKPPVDEKCIEEAKKIFF